jgi:hypothetical protein
MPPREETGFLDSLSSALASPASVMSDRAGTLLLAALQDGSAARRNLEFFALGLLVGLEKSNLRLDDDTNAKLAILGAKSAAAVAFPHIIVQRIPPFVDGFTEGLGSGAESLLDLAQSLASGELIQQLEVFTTMLRSPNEAEFQKRGEEIGMRVANQLAAALRRGDWETAVVRAVGRVWGEEVLENVVTGGASRLFRVVKNRATTPADRGQKPARSKALIDDRGLERHRGRGGVGGGESPQPVTHAGTESGIQSRATSTPDRHPTDTKQESRSLRKTKENADRTPDGPPDSAKSRSRPALVHQDLSKSNQKKDVVTTAKLDFEDIDGVPDPRDPHYGPFTSAFRDFIGEYEAALGSVWDHAFQAVLSTPKMQAKHQLWLARRQRLLHLMDMYPMTDDVSVMMHQVWREGLADAPATPAHKRLAERLGPAQYNRLVRDVNTIIAEAKSAGNDLYNATRTEAIKRMPTSATLSLIQRVNSLSRLPHGEEVLEWGVGDILKGKPPYVRGKQRGGDTMRPINLDHAARQTDDPWRAVDFGNLTAVFAKDNQVSLERVRKQTGFVTDDPIVQWLHSLRSRGERVSPEFSDPTKYDVTADPEPWPEVDLAIEEMFE